MSALKEQGETLGELYKNYLKRRKKVKCATENSHRKANLSHSFIFSMHGIQNETGFFC
jgi:hypothetical protein